MSRLEHRNRGGVAPIGGLLAGAPPHHKEGSAMSEVAEQVQGEVHYLWQVIEKLEKRIEVLELEGSDNPDNYKQSVASRLRWRWEQFKGKRKAVRRG